MQYAITAGFSSRSFAAVVLGGYGVAHLIAHALLRVRSPGLSPPVWHDRAVEPAKDEIERHQTEGIAAASLP
jgi:hypothetical protein